MDDASLMRSYKAEIDMYRNSVVQILNLTHGRKRIDADEVRRLAEQAHEESNRLSRLRRQG